jgi:hypothetical protein
MGVMKAVVLGDWRLKADYTSVARQSRARIPGVST